MELNLNLNEMMNSVSKCQKKKNVSVLGTVLLPRRGLSGPRYRTGGLSLTTDLCLLALLSHRPQGPRNWDLDLGGGGGFQGWSRRCIRAEVEL